MDPIAHTLFGATLSETGLKEKTALATTTLVIGANLPDVDAIAMVIGSDYSLLVRRGWTHGILALLLWPFLLTVGMLGVQSLKNRWNARNESASSQPIPPVSPGWLLAISIVAVWSHPFLDWLNTYGIRLLMPFDDTWFYGDSLFIIDPWFWLLCSTSVVLARSNSAWGCTAWILFGSALTLLVTSTSLVPPSAKWVWGAGLLIIASIRLTGRHRNHLRPLAVAMILSSLLYIAFMLSGSRMAVHLATSALTADGVQVNRAMSSPLPARPLLRTGVIESDSHYYRYNVQWLRPSTLEFLGDPIPVNYPNELAQAALQAPEIEGFINWMRFPLYETEPTDTGWRVTIRDLRYTAPDETTPSGIGMVIVDLDKTLQVVRVRN